MEQELSALVAAARNGDLADLDDAIREMRGGGGDDDEETETADWTTSMFGGGGKPEDMVNWTQYKKYREVQLIRTPYS